MLAKELKGHEVISEVVRSVAKKWGLDGTNSIEAMEPNKLFNFELQCLKRQIQKENAHANFISDRSIIDYFIYASLFGVPLSSKGYNMYDMISRYDLIVYVPLSPHIPLEDDGFRNVDSTMMQEVDTAVRYVVSNSPNGYILKSKGKQQRVDELMSVISLL